MTSRDFCYWLQGYFELENPNGIENNKVKIIRDHLKMVFVHETDPSHGDKTHQQKLDTIHQGLETFYTPTKPSGDTPLIRC